MRVIARKTLKEFWEKEPEAEQSLKAWFAEAKKVSWKNPNEIKAQYRNASVLTKGRVVFNICGNKYRLVVWVNYGLQLVYLKFVGNHQDYVQLDLEET